MAPSRNDQNRSDNTSVNIGLLVSSLLLIVVIVVLACTCEPFQNMNTVTFEIPSINAPDFGPSLQKLTTPLFNFGLVSTNQPMEPSIPIEVQTGVYNPMPPLPTEFYHMREMDNGSMEMIGEAQEIINQESENIYNRQEEFNKMKGQVPQMELFGSGIRSLNQRAARVRKPVVKARSTRRGAGPAR